MNPTPVVHSDGRFKDGWPVEKLQGRIDYYRLKQQSGSRDVSRDGEVILALAVEVERLRTVGLAADSEIDRLRVWLDEARANRGGTPPERETVDSTRLERERREAMDQHAASVAWCEYRDWIDEDDLRPVLRGYMAGWAAAEKRERS